MQKAYPSSRSKDLVAILNSLAKRDSVIPRRGIDLYTLTPVSRSSRNRSVVGGAATFAGE